MRAEDPAVCVQLVDDNIFEISEIVGPLCVVRQHSGVEHVRVSNDYMPLAARLPPFDGIGVAVIDKAVNLAVGEGGGGAQHHGGEDGGSDGFDVHGGLLRKGYWWFLDG